MEKIVRGCGFTDSERYLQQLSDKTFLKLWTYPNTFSNRNPTKGGDGKEICDLLVVCGRNLILFSDKSIEWPEAGTLDLQWKRWYKRAIRSSADQINGAERWIRLFPDRVFTNAKCTQPIPVEIPNPADQIFHGICIVRGAYDACSRHYDGDEGSLIISPDLVGDDHTDTSCEIYRPFAIGDVNPGKLFVHVFDEVALDTIMKELDTITDFTNYLTARAIAIREKHLGICANEPDLLSYYLQTEDHERCQFIKSIADKNDCDRILIHPGAYIHFSNSPSYIRKKVADQQSYFWDRLITIFSDHLIDGTSYAVWGTKPTITSAEPALRIMAQESRFKRRILSKGFIEALNKSEYKPENRFMRALLPGGAGLGIPYLLMTLDSTGFSSNEVYRKARASMLETYCLSFLQDNKQFDTAVGIAMNKPGSPGSSEDIIAAYIHDWNPEFEREVTERRKSQNIMIKERLQKHAETLWDYPPPPVNLTRQQRRALERKLAKSHRRQLS